MMMPLLDGTVSPYSLYGIFPEKSVSLTVLVVSLVAASGLALGSIKYRGLSFGIGGTMFTGLIFARMIGLSRLEPAMLNFIRDFGLILFVYAVGVQVGPGFLASLRRRGLPLNLMAMSIVLLGVITSLSTHFIFGVDIRQAVGLFAGGTTNAPALASAQEVLKQLHGAAGAEEGNRFISPAFAIAYPFGLFGVILAMVLIRMIFRVNPQEHARVLEAMDSKRHVALSALNLELKNPNLNGLPLNRIPSLAHSNVVVSRILHGSELRVAHPDSQVAVGDVLLAVGSKEELGDFKLTVGEESKVDLRALPSEIVTRQILVTHRGALGATIDELALPRRLGVTITRVSRADIEFTAVGNFRLQFGDRVRVVGEAEDIERAGKELGNSPRELNLPRLLPIFVGIALGVIVGSIPVFLPGLPAPVKLGLASGPMIVAILLARIGRIGPMIWYMPHNASSMLKEMGIVLFLIGVGLLGGERFFDTLLHGPGLELLVLGTLVTIVPLMIVGVAAQKIFKVNYLHVCGLLAGSMTSPSLPYTATMTASEEPAVAFATVYPLTMIMRVLLAQLMVLMFCR